MRNALEPDLLLCDYAFTNLSVGYRKRHLPSEGLSKERENTSKNKLPKRNVLTLPLILTDIPLDCLFGLQRAKPSGFQQSPIFMIAHESEVSLDD